MIPELEELMDTGIVSKSTALSMIRNLSVILHIEYMEFWKIFMGTEYPYFKGFCACFLKSEDIYRENRVIIL